MNKVIVFDLDDTLYLECDYVKSGFNAVSDFISSQFQIHGFFSVAWNLFELGRRGDIFNRALDEIGLDANDDKLIVALVDVYRGHTPNICLLDDGDWALRFFYDKAPLVLISDGYLISQQKKVEALGIAKFFAEIYFTDQWGREYWKPNSFAFKKVESRFSVSGESCIYIADNPKKDFISPNEMGWRSVRVSREKGEYWSESYPKKAEAKEVVNDLYALKSLEIF